MTKRVNEITYETIGAAIEVHRALGPGLLESAYEACLCAELARRGLGFERQKPVTLIYRGEPVGLGYRLDLLIESLLVAEVKPVEKVEPIHVAQLLSYLRLSGRSLGLLLNFNVKCLSAEGVRRVVNDFAD